MSKRCSSQSTQQISTETGELMPKYALIRELDPNMSRAEIDGAALTVLASEKSYVFRGQEVPQDGDHGIRWIRTYWEQGGTWALCLYEAPDFPALTAFEAVCDMPFVDGYEVEEIAGQDQAALDGDRVAVSMAVDGEANAKAAALTMVNGDSRETPDGTSWIRTYWDPEGQRVTALFRVPAGEPNSLVPENPKVDRVTNVVVVDRSEYQ